MVDELQPLPRVAFTCEEAARSLGWSEDQVQKAVREGHIAKVPHTGRRVLIAAVDLERFAMGLPPVPPSERMSQWVTMHPEDAWLLNDAEARSVDGT